MVVVIGIMAILSSLGLGGFIAYRSQAEVDTAAEKLATMIREAQNNSMTVKDGAIKPDIDPVDGNPDTDCNSVVWAIMINTVVPQINNRSYFECPNLPSSGIAGILQQDNLDLTNINVTASYTGGGSPPPASDTYYLAFASPFGRPALSIWPGVTSNGRNCSQLFAFSCWSISERPSKEWAYDPQSSPYLNYFDPDSGYTDYRLEITLEKNSNSRKVIIYSNGDVETK